MSASTKRILTLGLATVCTLAIAVRLLSNDETPGRKAPLAVAAPGDPDKSRPNLSDSKKNVRNGDRKSAQDKRTTGPNDSPRTAPEKTSARNGDNGKSRKDEKRPRA